VTAVEVRVRLFSHLRDLASSGEIILEVPEGTSASDLLRRIYAERSALEAADKTILIAAGVDFVDRGYIIRPGDEISIMPPVQGG
jgi:molybdopterin converting factor small subunit